MQTDTVRNIPITHEWRRWIAESKLLNVEDQRIIEILIRNGIEERLAVEEVSAITSHPYFQAGNWQAQKLRKLESILNVYNNLAALSSRSDTIERRSNLTRQEFLEEYYAANRPVILIDAMRTWKALALWNPEYLKEKCGNEEVEIMTGRETDPEYEKNSESHKRTILFRDYVEMVTSTGQSNDFYMVANNHFLEKEAVKELYQDIGELPEYLNARKLAGSSFLWFGPAGTITPLHHDVLNIFMAQMYGRKHLTLIPSIQTHLVYNNVGVYSEVNCDDINYDIYPSFRYVTKIELALEPGEILFIPVGWWHYVKALDVSITISFINFLYPNEYHWIHPEKDT
jgi:ribosomal protein L16 Arg81 hydroxylase